MGSGFDSFPWRSGPGKGSGWVGVLMIGLILTVTSVIGFSISASLSDSAETSVFSEMDREAARMVAIFASGTLIFGLILIVASFMARQSEQTRLETEARIAQERHDQNVQEIVQAVKSTIKVRCRYCGTLNEETASNCESCGAAL